MKSIKITYIILLITTTSCHEEWLDVVQDKTTVVPQTLTDMQAMLDNAAVMNFSATPMLGVVASDNYYLQTEDWKNLTSAELRNAYIWAEEIYEGNPSYSYNRPYHAVLYANLVLEGLDNIEPTPTELSTWKSIRGSALFYRSWMFFQLAQVYCVQYDQASAQTALGIVLRLESDVNIKSVRATVQETYNQIIKDLTMAIDLVPDNPLIKTRPSKAAVHALLARVHLQMQDYSSALNHAINTLAFQDNLMDYNDLDSATSYPFGQMNEEVIFHSTMYPFSAIFRSMNISTALFDAYDENDLRKSLYFIQDDNRLAFRGTYDASSRQFNGLATDEIYLIKAECEVRLNEHETAINTLNQLLSTRWKDSTYEPVSTEVDILEVIIAERRKTLPFRGIRWMDLRRLNKEEKFAVTLKRTVDDITYSLPQQGNRYTFPFPMEVIEETGMQQNPR